MSGSVTIGGDLTLAFELAALRKFSDPESVFADAREWSHNVGIVANDTEAVHAFVREHGLRQDFELGRRDKWLVMEGIREETETTRHVFVGDSLEDRRLADHLGWEFVSVTEAAEKAGWALEGDGDETRGLLARIRRRLGDIAG
jgi:FMN phosphatase YigB (HAD superfamily)